MVMSYCSTCIVEPVIDAGHPVAPTGQPNTTQATQDRVSMESSGVQVRLTQATFQRPV